MKKKLVGFLLCVVSLTMVSCNGRTASKAIQMGQKALKKTPKKVKPVGSGVTGAGAKYGDDAWRLYNQTNDED